MAFTKYLNSKSSASDHKRTGNASVWLTPGCGMQGPAQANKASTQKEHLK